MAYYKDLREYLEALEAHGKLTRIKRTINKDTELAPLVRCQFRGLHESERRGFLFENVTDARGRTYKAKVAIGTIAASKELYALALQCKPEEIQDRWAKALLHPIEPVMVPSGPCQEVVMYPSSGDGEGSGLDNIPIPIHTPGFDNAPYASGAHWVSKDLETKIRNMGCYRAQVKGRWRMGTDWMLIQHIGIHWQKCRQKGIPLESAIVLGGPPNVTFASVSKIPYGTDEYAISGALAGEPLKLVKCKTIDLEVPAEADVVIEGRLTTDCLEPEAPFGEYTGYMGQRVMNPFFEVTAITCRKDPIVLEIQSQFPPSESSTMRQISYEGVYRKFLKYDCNLHGILDIHFPHSGGGLQMCVIKMKKTHPAEPWRALHCAVGLDSHNGKIVIAVDDDIDIRDPDAVNWALNFRMQPHRDMQIMRGKTSALDLSGAPPEEEILYHLRTGAAAEADSTYPDHEGTSAVLINATRKWNYTPISLPKQEYMERAIEIWEEEGLPKLNLKLPWFGYSLGHWTKEDEEEADLAVKGEYYKTGEKLISRRKNI